MKKLITLLAAVSAVIATPAMAKQGTFGVDVANHGATYGRADLSGFSVFGLGAGVEARTRFGDRRPGVDELTGRVGYRIGTGRFSVTPSVQLGVASFNPSERNVFVTGGAGVEGRVNLVDRLDLVGSYNYRQSLSDGSGRREDYSTVNGFRRALADGSHRYRLNEFRAGGEFRLAPELAVNAGYFKRTGTFRSDGVSAGVKFGF